MADGVQKMLINGAWTEAVRGARRTIENPATREPVGMVADGGEEDVDRAVAAASAAQLSWATVPAREKGRYLLEIGARIRALRERLAPLLTRESGSPLCESADSIDWAAASFEEYGGILSGGADPLQLRFSEPVAARNGRPTGVLAMIGTFHFPRLLMASSVAAGLAADKAVVCKPPPQISLTKLALSEVYEVLPRGVVNVIAGGWDVDRALIGAPEVERVIIAGSRSAGEELARAAGAAADKIRLEPYTAEPILVLEDVDLDVAVPGVAWQSLRRSGQDPASSKRIYVHGSVAAHFADRMHENIAFLEVGDPVRADTDLGPLISSDAARRVEAQVAHAAKEGARLKLGGRCFRPWGLPGHFFQPTILTNMRRDSVGAREEIFGPLLRIIPVESTREAVELACHEGRSFTASVYTGDPVRARRAIETFAGGASWIPDEVRHRDTARRALALPTEPPAQAQFAHIATRKPWWFPYRGRNLAQVGH